MMTLLLGSTADGEGMPLVGGDGRDVEVDVVSRLVVEKLRPLNHEVRHLEEKEKLGASSGLIAAVGRFPCSPRAPGFVAPILNSGQPGLTAST